MKNILKFVGLNIFILQSIIYWIIAIFKINTDSFWFFAVAAVVFQGLQEIIDILRSIKLNQKNITNE